MDVMRQIMSKGNNIVRKNKNDNRNQNPNQDNENTRVESSFA